MSNKRNTVCTWKETTEGGIKGYGMSLTDFSGKTRKMGVFVDEQAALAYVLKYYGYAVRRKDATDEAFRMHHEGFGRFTCTMPNGEKCEGQDYWTILAVAMKLYFNVKIEEG